MASDLQYQALALSGIFQAAVLVDEVARKGHIDPEALESAVQSILCTSPDSVSDIYGQTHNLRQGMSALRSLLNRESKGLSQDVVRYAMGIMHIESKIRKNDALLQQLSQGISRSSGQQSYFDSLTHDAVIGSLAQTYSDTISTLSFRIQVTGNPALLQDERNASRIRTLLLAGVRSAVLWHQKGGHRWHFLFRKARLLAAVKEIQTRGLQ